MDLSLEDAQAMLSQLDTLLKELEPKLQDTDWIAENWEAIIALLTAGGLLQIEAVAAGIAGLLGVGVSVVTGIGVVLIIAALVVAVWAVISGHNRVVLQHAIENITAFRDSLEEVVQLGTETGATSIHLKVNEGLGHDLITFTLNDGWAAGAGNWVETSNDDNTANILIDWMKDNATSHSPVTITYWYGVHVYNGTN